MMFVDTTNYLPDDILTKVDRASMAVSLEARVPLLDHRVLEFAWRLPFETKVNGGVGKWILRKVLYRHVPQQLIERPKMGFGVPIGEWLRGPLRAWAEDVLNSVNVADILDSGMVAQKWRQHLSGRFNWQYCLWNVLMFQQWYMGGSTRVPHAKQRPHVACFTASQG
jgi:asparagine synthase (glutamine-hydrolysing)